MISRSHAFIFIHVPKTAGNSIRSVLQPFSEAQFTHAESPKPSNPTTLENFWVHDPEVGQIKHWTVQDYKNFLGEEFTKYQFFSTVRNPYDWALSLYYFRKQTHTPPWSRADKGISARMFDETEFLGFLAAGEPPQTSYLACDTNINIWLMRYETLAVDFATVCENLNIPRLTLPRLNSTYRVVWQEVLGPRARKEVETVYHADFIALEYSRFANRNDNGHP